MKVDVITVDDEAVKIAKWRWWSNWIDIAISDYDSRPWLIQMSVSRANAKRFKAVSITGFRYKASNATQYWRSYTDGRRNKMTEREKIIAQKQSDN